MFGMSFDFTWSLVFGFRVCQLLDIQASIFQMNMSTVLNFDFIKKTRARRTIGAKDKREVTSQKILKISFENIVAKLNK